MTLFCSIYYALFYIVYIALQVFAYSAKSYQFFVFGFLFTNLFLRKLLFSCEQYFLFICVTVLNPVFQLNFSLEWMFSLAIYCNSFKC